MRYFKKQDTSISFMLAAALVLFGCATDSSGPLGGPNVIQVHTQTVSAVAVTVAQSTLVPGQSTQATAIATSSDGKRVGGPIALVSQNPSIANVSSNGLVTAVAAGMAVIQATAGGHFGTTSVTVEALSTSAVVAAIAVTVDSTTLVVGNVAKATAIPKDASGAPIGGQTVTWKSLTPGIATVSQSGSVTAVAAGSATIQADASGMTGVTTLIVVDQSVSVLISHNFDDGTIGLFHGTTGSIDFPDDPTGSGRGKVARILYAPTLDNRSADKFLNYRTYDAGKIRYGRTIWFRGDFYLPTNPLSDPNWTATDIRKLIDWQGASDDGWTGGGARFTLGYGHDNNTNQPCLSLVVETRSTINGIEQMPATQLFAQFAQDKVQFEAWHTLEVRLVTNSADGVHDGSLTFWLDNSGPNPTYQSPSTLYFINEAWAPAGAAGVPAIGSYFNDFRFGSQLSNNDPEPLNQEYRYWDNITFSKARVGN
jgi:hypothetical protein